MREFDPAWQRTLYDGGWAGINWPTEYGGRGLTDIQQMIWYEEFARPTRRSRSTTRARSWATTTAARR